MIEKIESLYLNSLKFDPKLAKSLIARYYANSRVIVLIILTLLTAGIISFLRLPRELNPDVDLAIVNIVTTLPGASPQDVENLITTKIEKEVSDIANIDTMTSVSNESVSVITIQFLGNQDSDKALDEVQQKVSGVTDLPTEATDPLVQKLDFNDQPVWLVAIVGQTDPLSLTKIANTLEEKIENISGIRKVDVQGAEKEEVVIELNQKTLTELNVSPDQIAQALRSSDITFPAGHVDVNQVEYTVTLNNEIETVSDVQNIVITPTGKAVTLGQVANVFVKSSDENPIVYYRDHGNRLPAVQLSIYKSENETIDRAYTNAKSVIDAELKNFPGISSRDVINYATEITESFSNLQQNFVQSILFVLLALSVFLGIRQATIAAISLPLTIMCTLIAMNVFGISMNFLAVFSLLLALSLIGDDAIVIVQSSKQYQQKFKPFEAGLLVFRDFFIPIWTGTLTVVWSFIPLLLASGIIGKFIRPIPVVVSATLLSSTAIATLINLPLNIVLAQLKLPKRVQILLSLLFALLSFALINVLFEGSPFLLLFMVIFFLSAGWISLNASVLFSGIRAKLQLAGKKWPAVQHIEDFLSHQQFFSRALIDVSPLAALYQQLLKKVLKKRGYRMLVYGTIIGLVGVSIVFLATGLLKNEFFPKTDEDSLFVDVEGPAGWTQARTQTAVEIVEKELDTIPEIKEMVVSYGSTTNLGSGNFSISGHNVASITLNLHKAEDRKRTSSEISELLRAKFSQQQEAKVTVVEQTGGPPAGADLQINIKGDDLVKLEQISQDFKRVVQEIPGTVNVETSLKLSPGEVEVKLLPNELSERNLSAIQVGSWLRTALSGLETGDVVIAGKELDIYVRLSEEQKTLAQLQNLKLPTQLGSYTLSEVAQLKLSQSPTSITREDGKRVVRVTAGTTGQTTAPLVLKQFEEKAKSYKLEDGYQWDVGGVNQENDESVQSILRAMLISFTLILITMVLLLGSFRQAFIVMMVIPLAISGVFINFTIFGIPLSFPALIGVLALFGIVVNNALMLMDKINQNMHEGFSLYEGVADACASRIEPIFLTSLTGILGLLPITIADPLWRGLGGAIVAGLSISGLFVLFLVPSLYVEVFGSGILKQQLPHKK